MDRAWVEVEQEEEKEEEEEEEEEGKRARRSYNVGGKRRWKRRKVTGKLGEAPHQDNNKVEGSKSSRKM